MRFVRAIARSETPTASSRIWSQVADFISYDDTRYGKRACCKMIERFFFSSSLFEANRWCSLQKKKKRLVRKFQFNEADVKANFFSYCCVCEKYSCVCVCVYAFVHPLIWVGAVALSCEWVYECMCACVLCVCSCTCVGCV